MVLHRVLDEVFRSRSHVAVLRTLLDTATGFTGNEIARQAGMHPRSALKALTSLEALGIVRRQRGGRDHIFTLNRRHFLVKEALIPFYEAERRLPHEIVAVLSKALERRVVSSVIFGSVARKEETPESDLDLCCIVRSEEDKDPARDALQSAASTLHETFGVRIAPLHMTVDEIRKKSHSGFVKELLTDGRLVTGRPLRSLLNDKAPKQKVR
jgi:predicted nucleotidyltransferase